ncbi:MAG TPA: ABC transporter ATP-binding protein [Alphaproteobacteria bacterium]|nr:ABC transporter ATP-binding protein [Alphaproteobacteria bacterium]
MSSIRLDSARKVFRGRDEVVAADSVSLLIEEGEFFVLVGPSGSGKTTLLRLIAGLEEADSGKIFLDDDDVTDLRPRDRDIAMVFQDYALYPQLSVRDNIGFGLKRRKVPKDRIQSKVAELAKMLELENLLDRKPGQLSGGQRQRVALARAIAREPRAFLMDEPLSNLDANLRASTRTQLAHLHQNLKTTTVFVTHDQVDAMSLGERVAVMRDGRFEQIDTPTGLYENPASLFVAAFIGSPPINLFEAEIQNGNILIGDTIVSLGSKSLNDRSDGRGLIIGIRPMDFEDHSYALDPNWPRITVDVLVRKSLGSETELTVSVDARPVHREDVASALSGAGFSADNLMEGIARDNAIFNVRAHAKTQAIAGSKWQIAFDPDRLYVFNRETGELECGPQ